jgi:hypothetical protein
VKQLCRAHDVRVADRQREFYYDRGARKLDDGYDQDEHLKIIQQAWQGEPRKEPYKAFRFLTDFVLRHQQVLRSEVTRDTDLSELAGIEMPYESGANGVRCVILVTSIDSSKTLAKGTDRHLTSGAFRHRDVLRCPLSVLACFFVLRWHNSKEQPPDFTTRQGWYDIKLCPRSATDPCAGVHSSTQYRDINKAFKSVGVSSKAKTHSGRRAAAREAERLGVDYNQIQRAGHWNMQMLSTTYLSQLPMAFLRKTAGWHDQPGTFFPPRGIRPPPDSLRTQIWPWLDQWKDRFGPRPDQIDDMAAEGFTRLLRYLRDVFLQDACLLRSRYPHHILWQHPVFQHPEFAPFEEDVLVAIRDNPGQPMEHSILQVVPAIGTQLGLLTNHFTRLEYRLEDWKNSVALTMQQQSDRNVQQVVSLMQDQAALLHRAAATFVVSQRQPLPFESRLTTTAAAAAAAAAQPEDPHDPPWDSESLAPSRYCTPNELHTATWPPPPPPAAPKDAAALPPLPLRAAPYLPAAPPLPPPPPPPAHSFSYIRMRADVVTVQELWKEWHDGSPGRPSIEQMERSQPGWRKVDGGASQFFSVRKAIIAKVKELAQSKYNGATGLAIRELDELMQHQNMPTLNRLHTFLREGPTPPGRRQKRKQDEMG